ncbi:MAG: hypothetical protein ACHP84_02235 [Caulobacterales bacterium]|jgi:hypothetical protein
MPVQYRFLMLNPAMRVVQDITLLCLRDADALVIAEGIAGVNSVEVWDNRRLVGFVQSAEERRAVRAA